MSDFAENLPLQTFRTDMFRVAVTAIVKNEAVYINEWIEYHRAIGVEHFFIFDNNSSDHIADVISKYVSYGIVTLVSWPVIPGQLPAYNFAAKVFGHLTDWMIFIDLDEFVFLLRDETLPEFLRDFADWDQLLVPFMFFGSSGHIERPSGLVIENYVHRSSDVHDVVKAIVRPISVVFADTHMSITRSRRTCNEVGELVPERWRLEKPTGDRIRINHYYIKSLEDWTAKVARGEVDPTNKKTVEQFKLLDFSQPDSSMSKFWNIVKTANQKLASAESVPGGYASWSRLSEISYMRPWLVAAHAAARSSRDHTAKAAQLSQDQVHSIDMDLNLDRAVMNIPLSTTNLSILEEFQLNAIRAFDKMDEQLRSENLLFLKNHYTADPSHTGISESQMMIARPNDVGEAVIFHRVEGAEPGRNYIQLCLACPRPATVRIHLYGIDTSRLDFIGIRDVKLKAGLNLCIMTLSHRSYVPSSLRLNFHSLSAAADIILLRISQFY